VRGGEPNEDDEEDEIIRSSPRAWG